MQWNIVPEYVSLVFISILIVYSHELSLILTLKNKLFRLCLRFIFLQILMSIISIIAIENHQMVPEIANQAIQVIFLLATPLVAVFFLYYIIAVIWEDDPKIFTYFLILAIPYALYAAVVFTNPLTGLLYYIGELDGFTFGDGFLLIYIISMLYILASLFAILTNRKNIERSLKRILLIYISISLAMIGIQWIFPTIILSGSAATAAILIVYLYLQNKQIFLDALTGLQNRKAFLQALKLNMKRKCTMDIILISLDDFKMFNDRIGQLNADICLKSISQYLINALANKSIFRFSGDEFIIILDEDIRHPVIDVVETIHKRFEKHWNCNTLRGMLTTSIAVARFPDHAETVESIIALLEYCIDLSKRSGKGKIIYSDAETIGKMKREIQIIDLVKRGLAQDIFEVYYQPIYSVKEKRFTTAEALLRLSDSKLGSISPAEFIPVAEKAGLIVDIGFIVLNKVCQFISELDKGGVEIDAISVNISAIQLSSVRFTDNLLEIINRNRIIPGKLHLEITESVFVDKFDYINNMMQILNKYGICFYLDDFGTGYSNIANIVELPFEFIKIDKSILYEAVISKKCFSVLNGLSRTFAEVGIKVVVEGVETLEHSKLAKQINADYMQGYLFAHPMTSAEAIKYLGGKPSG